MATLSVTFSQFSANVKAVHTGLISAGGSATLAADASASSIFKLCQVPNKATLEDWWLHLGGSQAGQVLKLGTSQTPSGIMSATTLSQSYSTSLSGQLIVPTPRGIFNQGWLRAPGAGGLMPVRISLSDDAQPSSIWVHAKAAAVISNGIVFTFKLFYTMDGSTGRTTIR